jgi:large subunit ribosomal protein L5e
MKGAADGGLHIPHSEKRLPGQAEDGENGENKILRKRIFGVHIDEYMALLKGNDKGNLQFSQWNTVL